MDLNPQNCFFVDECSNQFNKDFTIVQPNFPKLNSQIKTSNIFFLFFQLFVFKHLFMKSNLLKMTKII